MDDRKYWEDNWANEQGWSVSDFAKKVYPIMKKNSLTDILDLGCDDGRDSIYFADKGLDVTALDFSNSGIQKLKMNDTQRCIKCINKDMRNINFPVNSFDAIYAHLSLHYFTDKELNIIIDKLYRMLKSSGYIFIKCKSTKDSLYGKGKKKEDNMFFYQHRRHFFTRVYMNKALKMFQVLKTTESETSEYGFPSSFIEVTAQKKS